MNRLAVFKGSINQSINF